MTQGLASSLSSSAESSVQGVHLSQHGEVLTVSQNDSDPGGLSQGLTQQRAGLGIMVFSSTCKVLYANQAAYHFLKALNWRENGHATHGALPVSIADLFDQILKSLESRITNREHQQLEARRVLAAQDHSVLLQAFGLPDKLGLQRPRVVITMQDVNRLFDAESSEARPLST